MRGELTTREARTARRETPGQVEVMSVQKKKFVAANKAARECCPRRVSGM
jgi:hypothetical protein